MKKILLSLLLGMFLINCVSAFEFDNVKSYDSQSKTATITNAFGLGDKIVEAKLLTENKVVGLFAGYQNVSMIDITSYQDYEELIKSIRAYQINSGETFDRQFDFKYLTFEEIREPDWECSNQLVNKSVYNICEQVGSHLVNKSVWKDLTSTDFKKDSSMTIGIFTDAREGDLVEWIPTVAGKEITEWASFGVATRFEYDNTNNDTTNTFDQNFWESQTFTIGNVSENTTVNFTGVSLLISKSGTPNTCYIELEATTQPYGVPNGTVYLNQTFNCTTELGTTATWTNFTLYNGTSFTLQKGRQYAIVIKPTAGSIKWAQDLSTEIYLGGEAYECSSGSCTWSALGRDSMFEVWGIGADTFPSVTLNQPANSSTTFTSSVTFNITGTDNVQLQNLSLIVDGARVSTNTSVFNNTLTQFVYSLGSTGNHNWSGEGCDNLGQCTNATFRHIWFNNSVSVVLNAPANNYVSQFQNIVFNATGIDDTNLVNISFILNGSYNGTNSSVFNNTLTQFSRNLADGFYNASAQACDNTGSCSNATTINFTVNTSPAIFVASPSFPANNSNYSTSSIFFNASSNLSVDKWIVNYNGTNVTLSNINTSLPVEDGFFNLKLYGNNSVTGKFGLNNSIYFTVDKTVPAVSSNSSVVYNYQQKNTGLPIYWTITDTHLSSCFVQWYNGTNASLTCANNVFSVNTTDFYTPQNLTLWANDTFGNYNSSFVNWTYALFDYMNYTYSQNITESTPSTFTGEFQMNTSLSSGYLQYNNTNYSVSSASLGNNRYILSKSVTSPAVNLDTNITWFFWVNNINATSSKQLVYNVNLSNNCTTNPFPLVYYYLEDELTQVVINNSNSTIESSISLRNDIGEVVYQFNNTFTANSTPIVCSQVDLSNSGLKLWEQSRYGLTNYQYEQHNVQNSTITAPLNYSLLDLPTSSATVFRITYKSSTFLPVQNAVVELYRKYIGEGIFKVSEAPLTDSNGEASASLDLDAVIYNAIVKLNGTILASFDNIAVACDNLVTGECFINLNQRQTTTLIDSYDTINDFAYGFNQSNRSIILNFNIPSGATKNVSMIVNSSTILGNYSACVQYVVATTGTIQCDINQTLGDVFATINVSTDGHNIGIWTTQILTDRSQYFGTDNIVLTFFLVLSLTLLMVSDAIAVLIGLIIGLVAGSLMLFLNSGSVFGTTSIVMYIIIVVIIIIVKIARRDSRI